jgi:hypothetical protein
LNLVAGLRYGYDQRNLMITTTLYVSGTGWMQQAAFAKESRQMGATREL